MGGGANIWENNYSKKGNYGSESTQIYISLNDTINFIYSHNQFHLLNSTISTLNLNISQEVFEKLQACCNLWKTPCGQLAISRPFQKVHAMFIKRT